MKYFFENSEIKAISFDLDGTLLNDSKQISPRLIEWLDIFQDYGGELILASSRKINEMTGYAMQLHMHEKKKGFIICSSGLYLYDVASGEKSVFPTLTSRKACQVSSALLENSSFCTVVTSNMNYIIVSKLTALHCLKQAYFTLYRKKVRILPLNKLDKIDSVIEKVYSTSTDTSSLTGIEDIHWLIIDGKQLDVYNCQVDKVYAISMALEKIGVSGDNVLFFGDDANDIMTFKKYSHTVAMKNGINSLKMIAENVTTCSNDEDGIFIFLSNNLRIDKENI